MSSEWDPEFSSSFRDQAFVPPPESMTGTVITKPDDPAIIDSFGEAVTLLAVNGQIAVNGAPDPTTAHVTEIVYSNHLVFVLSATGLWYSRSRMGVAWQATSSPLAPKITYATVQAEIDQLVATITANQTATLAALNKIRADVGKITF